METTITVKGFLQTIESSKAITINIYNQTQAEEEIINTLLITFLHSGYDSLEDTLKNAQIIKTVINNLSSIDIYIQLES